MGKFFDGLKLFFAGLKDRFRNLRLHWRSTWRPQRLRLGWLWIVLAVVLVYVIVGIVFAFGVYRYHKDGQATRLAVKIYPYPAAWVGLRPIGVKSFYEQMSYIKKFSQKSGQGLADESVIRGQILDQLIQTSILKKEVKNYKIKVTKDEVEQAYKKLAEENGGEAEVQKVLTEMYGMSVNNFKKLIADQLLVEKVQKDLLMQIQAKHILIKDENRAKEVLEKIKKGEKSFEDAAKEFSEDSGTKDKEGDLGWFGRGQMVKEFEEAAFKLQKDEMTQDLVKSEFGFHIIKVIDKKGQIDKSFTDWLNELKEKTKIRKWIH